MDAKTKIMQAVESKKEELILQQDSSLLEGDATEEVLVNDDTDNAIPGAHLDFASEEDQALLFF